MKVLSIKELVQFKRRKPHGKKLFAASLKIEKPKKEDGIEGGGDYWVSSLSAMSNSFRANSVEPIRDKVDLLKQKIDATEKLGTKAMYMRNAEMLYPYEEFDINKWRPSKNLTIVKKHNDDLIIPMRGFQIKASPHHVFSYSTPDGLKVGSIWFIAQVNGFSREELGMFAEISYRFLKSKYDKTHTINTDFCIAVDLFNSSDITYSTLLKKDVLPILGTTLDDLNKLITP